MNYVINITDEQGNGIAGAVYVYDSAGAFMSRLDVPAAGLEVPDYVVGAGATYQVDAPGYVGYAVLQLDAVNNFVLVKEPNKAVKMGLGLLVLFFAAKILKVL